MAITHIDIPLTTVLDDLINHISTEVPEAVAPAAVLAAALSMELAEKKTPINVAGLALAMLFRHAIEVAKRENDQKTASRQFTDMVQ